ncbi:MAG: hypothetical protein VZS44_00540 [Bacilli bacterium]|nr:hypothetical protein [Bacilli bacterium]
MYNFKKETRENIKKTLGISCEEFISLNPIEQHRLIKQNRQKKTKQKNNNDVNVIYDKPVSFTKKLIRKNRKR